MSSLIAWVVWCCRNEPVRVCTTLYAVLICAIAFNLPLTYTQAFAITGVAAAILGVSGEKLRAVVTPWH